MPSAWTLPSPSAPVPRPHRPRSHTWATCRSIRSTSSSEATTTSSTPAFRPYRREHLHQAQSVDKTVFEYWTHALSYLPTESLRFYVRQMRREWRRLVWFAQVSPGDLRRVVSRIRREGAITIRDIAETREEKDYAWGSRKPAKRALEAAFYKGQVTISRRTGMLKTYELLTRHFGWDRLPRAATEGERLSYLLDRALRAQGVVSLDSASYLNARDKPAMRRLVESRVRRKELIPVSVEDGGRPRTGSALMRSTPFPTRRRSRPTSSRRSIRWSSSASGSGSSSTTTTGSRRTCPATSGCSATSCVRCWWGTGSWPRSTSRPTGSGNGCWCSGGTGSGGPEHAPTGSGWRRRCTGSSGFSSGEWHHEGPRGSIQPVGR